MTKPDTNNEEYTFSQDEIESFIKTKQDFIEGKTTARDWIEIEEELDNLYPNQPLTQST